MVINAENILLVMSILLFVSIIAGRVSHKFGTPILLLFLVVGMAFGTDGFGIEFNSPKIVQFIGMVALSIILFSGGMDTKFTEIKPIIAPGIVLATAGVLLTALITGAFIYFLCGWIGINLGFTESLLLASVMASTDSASVFSILRQKNIGLKHNLRPILELESGSNDPMAYILTILLIQATTTEGMGIGAIIGTFLLQMFLGGLFGFLLGKAAVHILNNLNTGNKSLNSILLLAMVFFVFSFTDLVGGNGYLAVYIAGLIAGNSKLPNKYTLTAFFDGFTWLFQIVMVLSLGLLVNPHEMLDIAILGLAIGVFMIFISRPIAVFTTLIPFRKITSKMKLYISWVGLRGAVPIIFATYPMVAGVENSDLIFNTVFFITIISLLVQGTTVNSVAKWLQLAVQEKNIGFGINLPDNIKAQLAEFEVDSQFLKQGETLKEIQLPKGKLVIMIRRNEEYIVPKGDTRLMAGDILLLISEKPQVTEQIDEDILSKAFAPFKKPMRKNRHKHPHKADRKQEQEADNKPAKTKKQQ
ncbi:MAG: potassium/proton antiporter [Tidjanibacter sp.]|nr:potassium/proton antiporter [Tidjanibacter sp.]